MLYEINAQAVFDVELKVRANSLPEAEGIIRQLIVPTNVMSRLADDEDDVIDYKQDMVPTIHVNHHKEIPE